MFQDNYPIFSRDMILKAEMLEALKMYPRDFFQVMYRNYSDGVIAGASLTIVDGVGIQVNPGILKHKGVLYHLSEPVLLDEYERGKDLAVRVRFLEREENASEVRNETIIDICSPEQITDSDLELGHFVLKEGAMLRQDYQNFKDMATFHNTINILNVPYAMTGGESTISPKVLYQFGTEMLNYELTDAYDISFVSLCMQQQPMNRIFIEKYLEHRVDNISKGAHTNEQIHSYLVKALELARLGKGSTGVKRGPARRMLVD